MQYLSAPFDPLSGSFLEGALFTLSYKAMLCKVVSNLPSKMGYVVCIILEKIFKEWAVANLEISWPISNIFINTVCVWPP